MQVGFNPWIFKHDLLCCPIHRARQHFRSNLPRSDQPGPHFSLRSSCSFLSLSHRGLPIPVPWHKGFHSYKIVWKSLTNPNFIDEGTGRKPQFLDSKSDHTKKVDNKTLFQYAEFSVSLSMLGPLLCHSYSVFHPGAILTSELVIDWSVFRWEKNQSFTKRMPASWWGAAEPPLWRSRFPPGCSLPCSIICVQYLCTQIANISFTARIVESGN